MILERTPIESELVGDALNQLGQRLAFGEVRSKGSLRQRALDLLEVCE